MQEQTERFSKKFSNLIVDAKEDHKIREICQRGYQVMQSSSELELSESNCNEFSKVSQQVTKKNDFLFESESEHAILAFIN